MKPEEPEIVAPRGTLAQRIYQAALAVADEGKGVRFRFADGRQREKVIFSVQRLARLDGFRANRESSANWSATFWIDKNPSPKGRR